MYIPEAVINRKNCSTMYVRNIHITAVFHKIRASILQILDRQKICRLLCKNLRIKVYYGKLQKRQYIFIWVFLFELFPSFSAVIAAAPSDKKVFSDEFLNVLRNDINGNKPAEDPHIPSTVSPCMLFRLFGLL